MLVYAHNYVRTKSTTVKRAGINTRLNDTIDFYKTDVGKTIRNALLKKKCAKMNMVLRIFGLGGTR